MSSLTLLTIVLVGLAIWLGLAFMTARARARHRALNCIYGPSALLLDLSQGREASLVPIDRAIYGPEFSTVEVSTDPAILRSGRFDVVHIFGTVHGDGAIAGMQPREFLTLLEAASPTLVILASEGPGAGIERWRPLPFNFMVVAERRGGRFGTFLREVYAAMFAGEGFMRSWLKLAPQDERPDDGSQPAAYCVPTLPYRFFSAANLYVNIDDPR